MHVTQDELNRKLAEFTDWVARENKADRQRLSALERTNDRLARRLENFMALADDIGLVLGLVNQLESVISSNQALLKAKDDQISTLESQDATDAAAAAQAAPNAQALADGHDQLASLAQQIRDALSSASTAATPADVVPPAQGTTTGIPGTDSGGAGMAANVPAGSTNTPTVGGSTTTIDPTTTNADGSPVAPADASAGDGSVSSDGSSTAGGPVTASDV